MIRRIGIAAVILGALLTLAVGVVWVFVGLGGYGDGTLWDSISAGIGAVAIVCSLRCLYLAAPGLIRGVFSPRARWWTWTATLAFVALAMSSVWFFYLAFAGPLATAVAIRLASGPRRGHLA